MEIFAFGLTVDLFGANPLLLDLPAELTVQQLRNILEEKFPDLKKLGSYLIAVNNRYGTDETLIRLQDEVAVIPPVSGG